MQTRQKRRPSRSGSRGRLASGEGGVCMRADASAAFAISMSMEGLGSHIYWVRASKGYSISSQRRSLNSWWLRFLHSSSLDKMQSSEGGVCMRADASAAFAISMSMEGLGSHIYWVRASKGYSITEPRLLVAPLFVYLFLKQHAKTGARGEASNLAQNGPSHGS